MVNPDKIDNVLFNLEDMARDMALVFYSHSNPGIISRDDPGFIVWFEGTRSSWYRCCRTAVRHTVKQLSAAGA